MSRKRQDRALASLIVIVAIVGLFGNALKFVAQWWLPILLIVGIVVAVCFMNKKRKDWQERKTKEEQLRQSWEIVTAHIQELSVKEQQLVVSEGYGLKNKKKWGEEKRKFLERVIKPAIEGEWALTYGEDAILSAIDDEINMFREQSPNTAYRAYSENFSPIEYEQFCARLLTEAGWVARTTVATGDQGADVIATRDGATIVVQCKKYTSPVGNKAVQEAHAAKSFYNANHAAVVSNAAYTASAKQAAGKIGVLLLHHDDLPNLTNRIIA